MKKINVSHSQHPYKTILGIETSCDETSAAVIEGYGDRVKILSNVVSSSAQLQAKFGGVIPEQAAREQLSAIIPVISETINDSGFTISNIDAIAVTQGPGLIGSLLVGVETAKALSLVWNKPLIPVNHLIGHFYANWIGNDIPHFPCLGLLVSGGHTDLVLMKNHGRFEYIGGTRDDAAGECFDKSARLLGLPYPGGPAIARVAEKGNPQKFKLPRPMLNCNDFDFSFSGLKTAVVNMVHSSEFMVHSKEKGEVPMNNEPLIINHLAAAVQAAIVDVLVAKTVKATQYYNVEQVMLAGGVAANQRLREKISEVFGKTLPRTPLSIPPPQLCTDNAAMIAAAGYFNSNAVNPEKLEASPGLPIINIKT